MKLKLSFTWQINIWPPPSRNKTFSQTKGVNNFLTLLYKIDGFGIEINKCTKKYICYTPLVFWLQRECKLYIKANISFISLVRLVVGSSQREEEEQVQRIQWFSFSTLKRIKTMDTQSKHVSILIKDTLLGNFGKKKLVLIKFLLYFMLRRVWPFKEYLHCIIVPTSYIIVPFLFVGFKYW